MNRRSFLGVAAVGIATPVAVANATTRAPMRVSSNEQDRGYTPHLIGFVSVYLDGREMHQVMTADAAEGLVIKAREPLSVENDEIVLEKLRGRVVIEILPTRYGSAA